MMKRVYTALCALLLLLLGTGEQAHGQQKTVSGTVVDSQTEETLPGVNVVIKGTTRGTVTDAEGTFQLGVPSLQDTLQFSFVGYSTIEYPLNGEDEVTISMTPEAIEGEEMVVVGYGTQERGSLTGSVSQVSGEDFEQQPVSNVSEALQGMMPGVTVQQTSGAPGSGADISVRGVSSLNSGGALVIVDGVPGSLDNIATDDIESISVLKDASAAAIYGARASEGVVLVTTKEGSNEGLQVEYRGNFNINRPTRFPEKNDAEQNARLGNLAFQNAGSSPIYPTNHVELYSDPSVSAIAMEDGSDWNYVADFDWMDHFLDQSFHQTHNISISGGDDRTNYLVSGSWNDENGYFSEYGPDSYDRYNLRFNLSNEIIPEKLSVDSRLSLVRSNRRQPSMGRAYVMYTLIQAPPHMPLYNPDGTYARYGAQQNTLQQIEQAGFDEATEDEFEGRLSVNWNATDKISLKALGGYNVGWSDGTMWGREYYKYTPSGPQDRGWVNQPNRVVKSEGYNHYYSAQLQADYANTFGDHSIDVLLGTSVEESYTEDISTRRLNIQGNELPALNLGGVDNITNDWSSGDWGIASGFARFNYNYQERYLLETTIRADGSSRFPEDQRWGVFPSVSVGWRVTNENFMQNQSLFSFLKLKASYGELGNQNGLGLYDHIPVYTVSNSYIPFPGGDEQQVYNPRLPSQSRTWETVASTNVGAEMGFINDKLMVNAEYFIKRNKDMLVNFEVPSTIGIDVPTGNYGELRTEGWEASVEWNSVMEDIGLEYNIGFNIADSKNEITDLEQEFAEPSLGFQNIQGYPINSIFAYEADGYFQSQEEVDASAFQHANTGPGDIKYVDQDGDGEITAPNDIIHAGTNNPRYTFGVNLGLAWNNFDFSAFVQGVAKRTFYLNQEMMAPFINSWDRWSFKLQNDHWTPDNPDARFPRPMLGGHHNYQYSTHWTQDASYVRLKNLQLGYTLPSSLLQTLDVNSIRLFFSGRDLWEATDLILYDPEINRTDGRVYPLNRTYSLGLNITF